MFSSFKIMFSFQYLLYISLLENNVLKSMLGKITYNRQGEIIGKVLIKTNILQYTLVAINVAKKLHKL